MAGDAASRHPGQSTSVSLPESAYIPGGPWPRPSEHASANDPALRGAASDFHRGLLLFNEGFYWEAHEAWERLWHALGRHGPRADMVKALIKLAAAGVKVRQNQPAGVRTHATRAYLLFETLGTQGYGVIFGLNTSELAAQALAVQRDPPRDREGLTAKVVRVFPFRLEVATERHG